MQRLLLVLLLLLALVTVSSASETGRRRKGFPDCTLYCTVESDSVYKVVVTNAHNDACAATSCSDSSVVASARAFVADEGQTVTCVADAPEDSVVLQEAGSVECGTEQGADESSAPTSCTLFCLIEVDHTVFFDKQYRIVVNNVGAGCGATDCSSECVEKSAELAAVSATQRKYSGMEKAECQLSPHLSFSSPHTPIRESATSYDTVCKSSAVIAQEIEERDRKLRQDDAEQLQALRDKLSSASSSMNEAPVRREERQFMIPPPKVHMPKAKAAALPTSGSCTLYCLLEVDQTLFWDSQIKVVVHHVDACGATDCDSASVQEAAGLEAAKARSDSTASCSAQPNTRPGSSSELIPISSTVRETDCSASDAEDESASVSIPSSGTCTMYCSLEVGAKTMMDRQIQVSVNNVGAECAADTCSAASVKESAAFVAYATLPGIPSPKHQRRAYCDAKVVEWVDGSIFPIHSDPKYKIDCQSPADLSKLVAARTARQAEELELQQAIDAEKVARHNAAVRAKLTEQLASKKTKCCCVASRKQGQEVWAPVWKSETTGPGSCYSEASRQECVRRIQAWKAQVETPLHRGAWLELADPAGTCSAIAALPAVISSATLPAGFVAGQALQV
eukprot:gnl/Hemi2/15914_TR5259_c0_g1_i2.p1 gnl/Hemi2/15914_TR5259_c0_g1~~gnl/Hemi2/15914_TR5259_c0_g1_i2.p1  ORF type:complete len:622 (-),score=145.20 gnl/Hemi2/15914_TR5259_c0_g1_i2:85-1950(-)